MSHCGTESHLPRIVRLMDSAAAIALDLEGATDGSYEYAAGRLAGLAEAAAQLTDTSPVNVAEGARKRARSLRQARSS